MLELTFPAPTPARSENYLRGKHWARVRRELKPWKEAAAWALRMVPRAERELVENKPCVVEVTIPFATAQPKDPHNYVDTVVKAIVDGIKTEYVTYGGKRIEATAGLWPDDGPEWVTVKEPVCVKGGDVVVRVIPREAA